MPFRKDLGRPHVELPDLRHDAGLVQRGLRERPGPLRGLRNHGPQGLLDQAGPHDEHRPLEDHQGTEGGLRFKIVAFILQE